MPEADIISTSYNDLVAAVKRYYEPTPSKIAQRCIFRQSPGESIVAYAAALWEIAQHCDYRDTLSDMLRDRLVCGVLHGGTQKKLLAMKDLTYEQALELATSMEAAKRDARQLKFPQDSHNTAQRLHYTGASSSGEQAKGKSRYKSRIVECYRCGENHLAS